MTASRTTTTKATHRPASSKSKAARTESRQKQIRKDAGYPHKLFVVFTPGSPALKKTARKTIDAWYRTVRGEPKAGAC